MRRIVAIAMLLSLTGCFTIGGMTAGPKCPPNYKWTKDFREKLAAEVDKASESVKEALAELQETRNWIHDNCGG